MTQREEHAKFPVCDAFAEVIKHRTESDAPAVRKRLSDFCFLGIGEELAWVEVFAALCGESEVRFDRADSEATDDSCVIDAVTLAKDAKRLTDRRAE